MHQGIPRWNAANVWLELQRLKGHHGFPTGENLMCPVFTQHKFHYLCALRSFVAPTLAVKFPQVDRVVDIHGNERISSTVDSASSFNVDDLDSFLGSHMETGWVVKLPFYYCSRRHEFLFNKGRSLLGFMCKGSEVRLEDPICSRTTSSVEQT